MIKCVCFVGIPGETRSSCRCRWEKHHVGAYTLANPQYLKQVCAPKHLRAGNRIGLACPRICACLHKHTDNLIFPLKHRAGKWRLSTVVQPIRIRSTFHQSAYKSSVTSVRREHQQRITFCPTEYVSQIKRTKKNGRWEVMC